MNSLERTQPNAAFFHFYAIDRDDVDYILKSFPIVKCKDEVARSMRTGRACKT